MKKEVLYAGVLTGLVLIAATLMGYGCSFNDDKGPSEPNHDLDDEVRVFTYDFDFEDDEEGWVAGFADLPADYDDKSYKLDSEYRELPPGLDGHGIYIQGVNRSDDLFMYLKKQIEGLSPGTSYQVKFKIELATNVSEGLVGVGGSPGENVYVKAGAVQYEPTAKSDEQNYLRMNIDKGNQASEGSDMINLGHIAHPELTGVTPLEYKIKSLDNGGRLFEATTNDDGTLWFIIGTDSGFESITAIYYDRINIILTKSDN
jgi:hypothetical protein